MLEFALLLSLCPRQKIYHLTNQMPSKTASRNTLYMMRLWIYGEITRQPGFLEGRIWRGTLFWIIARPDGWLRLFACAVTEYSSGCIRLDNTKLGECPKSLWPFPVIDTSVAHRFELTVHESEIKPALGGELYRMMLDPDGYVFEWPGFQERGKIPSNALSLKASEHWKATHPDAFKRRSS